MTAPPFPLKRNNYADPSAKIRSCIAGMLDPAKQPQFRPSRLFYTNDNKIRRDPASVWVVTRNLAKLAMTFNSVGSMVFEYPDTYYEFGVIVSDLIPGVEEARMQTEVNGLPSLWTRWNDDSKFREVVQERAKNAIAMPADVTNAENFQLREALYEAASDGNLWDGNRPGEAAQFGAGKVLALYQLFNPTAILDPCSGWGDRLTASIVYQKASYIGCDPNDRLYGSYDYMCDVLPGIVASESGSSPISNRGSSPISKGGFGGDPPWIMRCGFEDAVLPDGRFDLAFTSPPYFDKEVYSRNANQSTSKWNTMNLWFDGFLCMMLQKCWSALRKGGVMAIHLQDTKTCVCVERMLYWCLENLPGCKWRMLLGYRGVGGSTKPVWCFEKH